jgi:glycosyltransferase involved in cell wall biosynthesis
MPSHSQLPPRRYPRTSGDTGGWCTVQAGHREQYGIPRALERAGALDFLITDMWVPPGSLICRLAVGSFGRRLRDRYHVELDKSGIRSFERSCLIWEAGATVRRLRGGERVLARNDWWGATASRGLRRFTRPSTRFVFCYCYESRPILSAARDLGLVPMLGQIDPGPVEDEKVAEVVARWPQYQTPFQRGTEAYYASWREECRLADRIVVNSEWSHTALEKAGIAPGKIAVVPLVYTPPPESVGWSRAYPDAFSARRPLRVLFLGQCILRKGIAETIEAAQALSDKPVEFTLVGNSDISGLEKHFGRGRIRRVDRISRSECYAYFRDADVFLFPTHSDGFGLTQLEAQTWKLPIIASRFCGRVVEPGRTGWMLEHVSGEAIAEVINEILADPSVLTRLSRQITPWSFGISELGSRLCSLEPLGAGTP